VINLATQSWRPDLALGTRVDIDEWSVISRGQVHNVLQAWEQVE